MLTEYTSDKLAHVLQYGTWKNNSLYNLDEMINLITRVKHHHYQNLAEQVCTFCTFVFIFASTAKVIGEYRPINVVSQTGIEPETLRFQDNHETHCATEVAWLSTIASAFPEP